MSPTHHSVFDVKVCDADHVASAAGMLALLRQWAHQGWLRELDCAFAAFLLKRSPQARPLLILASALACHQLGRGHVCLDLAATLENSRYTLSLPPDHVAGVSDVLLPTDVLAGVTLAAWQDALAVSPLVTTGPGNTPLVLVQTRLYLRRYWQFERFVRSSIDARVACDHAVRSTLDPYALTQALDRLFEPAMTPGGVNWQKLACAVAAGSAFSIITGGPGTGKTTTVVRLLAVLQSLALQRVDSVPLRIRLAAPTGKAAARLSASVAGAIVKLPLSELGDAQRLAATIPVEVTTLHRLLGAKFDSRHFHHHAGHPLGLDVLVIDEASMIDLEMMAAVLDALPLGARLVLLGDKDQLASVEAGAVLGELCTHAQAGRYWPKTVQWLAEVTGQQIENGLQDAAGEVLDQNIVMLRHSHRFGEHSGIGQLAGAVNRGDYARLQAIKRGAYPDLAWVDLAGADEHGLHHLVVEGGTPADTPASLNGANMRAGYRYYLNCMHAGLPPPGADAAHYDRWAHGVLQAHSQFQVLCALRAGPWGVGGLNQRITALLRAQGLIVAQGEWYLGRPVLVTRNDASLGLMNGDIGITLYAPADTTSSSGYVLRVAFADGRGGIRWVLPSRLQAIETVYAMTVHKSQGSEFMHAALVLPPIMSPILTRELIYTGITRAKQWFTWAAAGRSEAIAKHAISRLVRRASGLRQQLS
jgi:exodeoxyribonuclease V alpha subunit